MIDGHEATLITPPPGWLPINADATQLAAMNYAPRPTGAADLARWVARASAIKQFVLPDLCILPDVVGGSITGSDAGTSAGENSGNWGGEEGAGSHDDHYREVEAVYKEASSSTTCSDPEQAHATWVGLGGDPHWEINNKMTNLIQDGSIQTTSSHYTWWEIINGSNDTGIVASASLGIKDGDNMDVDTTWGGVDVQFTITDQTNTRSTGTVEEDDPGTYDGSTADFIDERPLDSKKELVQLRHFNDTQWEAEYATDSAGVSQTLHSYPWFHVSMISGSTTLNSITNESGGSFQDNWLACGTHGS